MCENQRDVLAIVTLKNDEIKCVCSRVFIRNKEKCQQVVKDYEEFPLNESIEKVLPWENRTKLDAEPEHLSCYCSASHTDTLSNDEHDSLKESLIEEKSLINRGGGAFSSDSGADSIDDLYYPDWQKFWSIHGEHLIWESWIEKYSAYINPEYLNSNTEQTTNKQAPPPALSSKFSFEETEIATYQKCSIEREFSNSDELINKDISEGWNPLSPLSVVGGAFEQQQLTEEQQLLAPRCGGSVRTVDSMTNVTRMTVSSLDFDKSSTDSLSSVTSVESSVSSNSSIGEVVIEEEEDNDKRWNLLWKKHYQDEYLLQYHRFLIAKETTPKTERPEIIEETLETSLEHSISNLKMSDEPIRTKTSEFDDDTTEMAALGLPTAFGKQTEISTENFKKPFTDDNTNSNSSRNRIRAAFNLLGIEFTEPKGKSMGGAVDFKMKNIRLQNRSLKFGTESKRPRHTFFDDEGNPILEESENDEENYQSILSDCSEKKLSSAEEEEDDATTDQERVEEKDKNSKKRKRKKKISFPLEIKDNSKLKKYWWRRFSLFSRFDEGIKLDEESWYSVTPELVAKHLAERCQNDVIIDAFCGAGGNTIQFALICKKVIAIDIDPAKVEMAKNNAEVYGVADKVEFIVGDFLNLAPCLKGDVVFMSPPWGGPSYKRKTTYDLEEMLKPVPYSKLMECANRISSNIAVFLPKNSNTHDLIKYAGERGEVEIEQNFINKRLIAITVYYNDLIKKM